MARFLLVFIEVGLRSWQEPFSRMRGNRNTKWMRGLVLIREVGVIGSMRQPMLAIGDMGRPMVAGHRTAEYDAAQRFFASAGLSEVDVGRAQEGKMIGGGRKSRRRSFVTGIISAVLVFAHHSQKNSAVLECR